jgi:molybdopterin synthase sulfur carrier subunit
MPVATAIEFFIPSLLTQYCGGARTLELSATTVRSALDELSRRYPALYVNICDETGAVRRHIGVFVNEDHIRDLHGLDTPLVPGDAVTILPAVSGG